MSNDRYDQYRRNAEEAERMSNDRYDQYRRNAEEAERQAKNAKNEDDRAAWLLLVRGWLALLPQRKPDESTKRTSSVLDC